MAPVGGPSFRMRSVPKIRIRVIELENSENSLRILRIFENSGDTILNYKRIIKGVRVKLSY